MFLWLIRKRCAYKDELAPGSDSQNGRRATSELVDLFSAMSDLQIALFMCGILGPCASPEEQQVLDRLDRAHLEEMCGRALGPVRSAEERDRRLTVLTEEIGVVRRRAGIRPHFEALRSAKEGLDCNQGGEINRKTY